MSTMQMLGETFKTAREKAGLTQTDVAEKLGYTSAQFVSNWERGLSAPPMRTLPKLNKIFKNQLNLHTLQDLYFQAGTEMLKKKIYGK